MSTMPASASPLLDQGRGVIWIVADAAKARPAREALGAEHDVEIVSDDRTLLTRIAAGEKSELILLGAELPGPAALETLRLLRKTHDELALPVLFLTSAAACGPELAAALAAGANDCLAPPHDPTELRARVRTLLRCRRLAARAVRGPGAVSAEQSSGERTARAEADAARAHLHDLFMQAPTPIAVMSGPAHVLTLLNAGYQQLLGKDRRVLGKTAREALPELAGQGFFELLDHVFGSGEPFVGTEVAATLDSAAGDGTRETRYFNFVFFPYRGPTGQVQGVTATAFEVTDQVQARRRAEALAAELRKSEELFRVAQEVSPIAFSYFSAVRDEGGGLCDLELIYQNEAAARLNNLPAGRAGAGARLLPAFPTLRETELWNHYRAVAATGKSWQGEIHYRGEHLDAWFRITATRPAAGTFALAFEDMTARRRMEEAERQASARVIEVLESMGDAFFALDEEWRITLVNRRQEQISQSRREETLGKVFWDVFPAAKDPASKYWTEYHRCVTEQVPVHFEEHYAPLDVWTQVDAFPTSRGGLTVFFRDVTGRKRLEAERERLYEAARASELQFRTLADSLPILSWYAAPDGHIPWYNRRWHEYTGMPLAEQEGWKWQSVHDPADVARVTARWRAALASGAPWEDTFRLRRHDGVFRWFLSRALPLRDDAGRIVRWFGTNVDIDDQKRANEALEEANRVKDEFLSVASHELRTPLSAILGWSRMLRMGVLSEEKRTRALETIERNAKVQVQLVDDILDVSRIITGKLRLTLAPVDLMKVLDAATEVVRPAADAKGVRLEVLADPDAGIVHGDADRLQQVVWNLLANAIKFTPKGGRVYLRMERVGSAVEMVVADTGAGIDGAFLPYVFQPFRQQDASVTRTQGGLGLGLAIGKHLVELHGGRIEAYSAGVGKGATFTVRLPISPFKATAATTPGEPEAAPPRGETTLECPPELAGLDVIIVDDEPDARELLRSILEQCRADVRVAASAAEALEHVARRPPHLLVSDIGMPGQSGYELIGKIRALPADKGGRTPAIALTAYAGTKDRTRALMEGFTAHAAKPIDPQELVAVIVGLLGRHRRGEPTG